MINNIQQDKYNLTNPTLDVVSRIEGCSSLADCSVKIHGAKK